MSLMSLKEREDLCAELSLLGSWSLFLSVLDNVDDSGQFLTILSIMSVLSKLSERPPPAP